VQNLIDAFPTKLFEYMSAGLPIIASDYPICRRVVDDSGVGLLVDPRDSGKVADAMRWMLDHPKEAEEMGSRGPDAVRDRYSWDSEGKKLWRCTTRWDEDRVARALFIDAMSVVCKKLARSSCRIRAWSDGRAHSGAAKDKPKGSP